MADPTNPTPPDDKIESFWEDLRGAPIPEPDLKDHDIQPGELVICTQSRILVRIRTDGSVQFGEGYTPNDAAEEFWTLLALKRKGMEERLTHLGILEQMLVQIGHADLRTERLRLQARLETATAEDRFQAERAMGNLEALVHQMIELSRGLALRPEVDPTPTPAVPPEGDPPRDLHWDESGFP